MPCASSLGFPALQNIMRDFDSRHHRSWSCAYNRLIWNLFADPPRYIYLTLGARTLKMPTSLEVSIEMNIFQYTCRRNAYLTSGDVGNFI